MQSEPLAVQSKGTPRIPNESGHAGSVFLHMLMLEVLRKGAEQ